MALVVPGVNLWKTADKMALVVPGVNLWKTAEVS